MGLGRPSDRVDRRFRPGQALGRFIFARETVKQAPAFTHKQRRLFENFKIERGFKIMSDDKKKMILVSSLISHRDHGPRIDITVGEIRVQLSAMEARDLINNLTQCVAAAESDAFIFNFLREKLDQPIEISARLIQEFRDYRDELERQWKNES